MKEPGLFSVHLHHLLPLIQYYTPSFSLHTIGHRKLSASSLLISHFLILCFSAIAYAIRSLDCLSDSVYLYIYIYIQREKECVCVREMKNNSCARKGGKMMDDFQAIHKLPHGDSPYVRAKYAQVNAFPTLCSCSCE